MYSIKRLISVLTLTGLFALTSFAQAKPGAAAAANAGKWQAQHLAVMTKALNLSDAQVTSIRQAVQAERPELKTLAADVKAKREALKAVAGAANPNPTAVGNAFLALRASRASLKVSRQKLQAEIRKVLTPDQQKAMDALKVVAQARSGRFHRFGAQATARSGH